MTPDEAGRDGAGGQPLPVIAVRLRQVLEQAGGGAGRPLTLADASRRIYNATGQEVSISTLSNLVKGKQTNPGVRVIDALAATFNVKKGFLLGDDDEPGPTQGDRELLDLLREPGITVQLRALTGLSDEGRKAVADMIQFVVRAEAAERDGGQKEAGDGG